MKNNQITASSEYNAQHAAWLGRLRRTKRKGYVGAWCAKHNNHNQWFKVDFRRPVKIAKIATQGRQDASQWVTRYMVYSSLDGIHWSIYRFKNNDKVSILGVLWKHLSVQIVGLAANLLRITLQEGNRYYYALNILVNLPVASFRCQVYISRRIFNSHRCWC